MPHATPKIIEYVPLRDRNAQLGVELVDSFGNYETVNVSIDDLRNELRKIVEEQAKDARLPPPGAMRRYDVTMRIFPESGLRCSVGSLRIVWGYSTQQHIRLTLIVRFHVDPHPWWADGGRS